MAQKTYTFHEKICFQRKLQLRGKPQAYKFEFASGEQAPGLLYPPQFTRLWRGGPCRQIQSIKKFSALPALETLFSFPCRIVIAELFSMQKFKFTNDSCALGMSRPVLSQSPTQMISYADISFISAL
jgi:hypothetical protein